MSNILLLRKYTKAK